MGTQRGRFKKKKEEGNLIITSLIDIFTILTIYLIQNYSGEGNLVAGAENLSLPNSNSTKKLEDVTLQMAVAPDMILVDNVAVVPTEDVAKIPQENADPVITKLEQNLKTHFAKEEEMVKTGALNKVEGKIVIQLDKNIPFDVLYKVMYTCSKAGYRLMNFAVMQREQD